MRGRQNRNQQQWSRTSSIYESTANFERNLFHGCDVNANCSSSDSKYSAQPREIKSMLLSVAVAQEPVAGSTRLSKPLSSPSIGLFEFRRLIVGIASRHGQTQKDEKPGRGEFSELPKISPTFRG